MLIDDVHVAAAGIGLPDFHQRLGDRTPVLVKHLAMHDDALAQRLALVLLGEVVVGVLYRVVTEGRPVSSDSVCGTITKGFDGERFTVLRYSGDRCLGKPRGFPWDRSATLSSSLFLRNAFNRQRHALPDADAHGGECELAATLFQSVRRGHRQPRARHAERMAKRDRPAMRIDVRRIVGKPKLPQAS